MASSSFYCPVLVLFLQLIPRFVYVAIDKLLLEQPYAGCLALVVVVSVNDVDDDDCYVCLSVCMLVSKRHNSFLHLCGHCGCERRKEGSSESETVEGDDGNCVAIGSFDLSTSLVYRKPRPQRWLFSMVACLYRATVATCPKVVVLCNCANRTMPTNRHCTHGGSSSSSISIIVWRQHLQQKHAAHGPHGTHSRGCKTA